MARLPESTSDTFAPAADERDQVARPQVSLIHTELNCGERTRIAHRFVLALIEFNQINQDIEFVELRAAGRRIHQRVNPSQCVLIILFGPNRFDLSSGHLTPPEHLRGRIRRGFPQSGHRQCVSGS